MFKLHTLILIAGLLHFCILSASALVPIVLDWRRALLGLHPFIRLLVWTYGGFVVLTIIGFGTLSVSQSHALSAGTGLARAVCGFIAVFWSARLFLQLFVMDIRPIVKSRALLLGDKLLTIVFAYFTLVFWIAAIAPRLLG
jgi:hypothetical protein